MKLELTWYKEDETYKDLSEKTLQKMANDLEKILLLEKEDNEDFCGEFFEHGWVNILGYEFSLKDPIYVLCSGQDCDGGNIWYEFQVPCKNPKLVREYVKSYMADSDVTYFIMPDKSKLKTL